MLCLANVTVHQNYFVKWKKKVQTNEHDYNLEIFLQIGGFLPIKPLYFNCSNQNWRNKCL